MNVRITDSKGETKQKKQYPPVLEETDDEELDAK